MAFLLDQRGINVEAKDIQGRTPLFCAVSVNNVKVARLIISKGARTDTSIMRDGKPFHTESCEKEDVSTLHV